MAYGRSHVHRRSRLQMRTMVSGLISCAGFHRSEFLPSRGGPIHPRGLDAPPTMHALRFRTCASRLSPHSCAWRRSGCGTDGRIFSSGCCSARAAPRCPCVQYSRGHLLPVVADLDGLLAGPVRCVDAVGVAAAITSVFVHCKVLHSGTSIKGMGTRKAPSNALKVPIGCVESAARVLLAATCGLLDLLSGRNVSPIPSTNLSSTSR